MTADEARSLMDRLAARVIERANNLRAALPEDENWERVEWTISMHETQDLNALGRVRALITEHMMAGVAGTGGR